MAKIEKLFYNVTSLIVFLFMNIIGAVSKVSYLTLPFKPAYFFTATLDTRKSPHSFPQSSSSFLIFYILRHSLTDEIQTGVPF